MSVDGQDQYETGRRALPRGARVRRYLLIFAPLLLLLYLCWTAFMYSVQDAMIFPGAGRVHAGTAQPGLAPADTPESVWITTAASNRVEAWYQPGTGRGADSPGPALMYFHGNADLIDNTWPGLRAYLDMGLSVLVMEYRGFGRSGGTPSEEGIVADAVAFHDWLADRPEIDGRIVYQGLSLGGGVAAGLAHQRPPAAMILECTFTSMEAMARGYLLPGFLCRNPFRTDEAIATLDMPILIMHGRHDMTISVKHARRLHELAPNSTYIELDCGHDNYHNDWPALVRFLKDNNLRP
ncbi:MAG: alpha/beta hydrolase [Planctomycetota bacterium]